MTAQTTLKEIAALVVFAILYPYICLFGYNIVWTGTRWEAPWFIEVLEKAKWINR